MVEKFRKSLDRKGVSGAFLTDLSKAFDCLPHDLLIAKLDAYGFSTKALELISDYLSKRYHRTKVGSSFSSWACIIFGVPQGSILGPLLFNIFLCDLFLIELSDIASYADDTTPYACDENIERVVERLTKSGENLFSWFSMNGMKANPDKCHLLLSKNENLSVDIAGADISNSSKVKLLGVTLDSSLKFDTHVNEICSKANRKLSALIRLAKYIDIDKRKILIKSFILSQFSYCPLIWMFHSRNLNNKINHIHERALRITYQDNVSTFDELLNKDCSIRIHHRNIQLLAIEMYKFLHGLSPPIISDLFVVN
jgi:hypothetical protein